MLSAAKFDKKVLSVIRTESILGLSHCLVPKVTPKQGHRSALRALAESPADTTTSSSMALLQSAQDDDHLFASVPRVNMHRLT